MKKFFAEFKAFAMRGNVLDMARIESGKSQLDLRAHRIPDALRDGC